ncbi:MAG TPA: extracellular solute-binding protein [Candidatus Acidoferrales bacterium]|nr:extracellular solute-binding protein [Candidatus Acidoferrales bacterium]
MAILLQLACAVLLALVFIARALAQDQKLMDRIIAGARKEGQVKVGLTTRWEEGGKPAAKRIVELFQSRYPFVKVDYERIGGSRERERVLSELAAGRVSHDVAVLSSTQVPVALKANLIERIDWKAFAVHPRHIHQDGGGVFYRSQVYGIAYNRKLVPDSIGEKLTWEDCADPKWKKKVAMDNRPRHLEIFWQPHVWGREKTLTHARALAANQTTFERSRSDGMTKLSLGEYPIFCGATYSTYKELVTYREARHLGYTLPEPVPVPQGDVVFVPRGAAHPNAGTLWIVWSLTEEGQKILDAVEFSGSPFIPGTELQKLLKGKKAVWYEPQYAAKAEEILKEIIEAIGLPIVR